MVQSLIARQVKFRWVRCALRIEVKHNETVEAVSLGEAHHFSHCGIGLLLIGCAWIKSDGHQWFRAVIAKHKAGFVISTHSDVGVLHIVRTASRPKLSKILRMLAVVHKKRGTIAYCSSHSSRLRYCLSRRDKQCRSPR